MADIEGRIEKAFYAQTRFLVERTDELKTEFSQTINTQTRCIITLILTMNITTIAAVLFKS